MVGSKISLLFLAAAVLLVSTEGQFERHGGLATRTFFYNPYTPFLYNPYLISPFRPYYSPFFPFRTGHRGIKTSAEMIVEPKDSKISIDSGKNKSEENVLLPESDDDYDYWDQNEARK